MKSTGTGPRVMMFGLQPAAAAAACAGLIAIEKTNPATAATIARHFKTTKVNYAISLVPQRF